MLAELAHRRAKQADSSAERRIGPRRLGLCDGGRQGDAAPARPELKESSSSASPSSMPMTERACLSRRFREAYARHFSASTRTRSDRARSSDADCQPAVAENLADDVGDICGSRGVAAASGDVVSDDELPERTPYRPSVVRRRVVPVGELMRISTPASLVAAIRDVAKEESTHLAA